MKTIIFSFFISNTIIIIVMLPLWLQNRKRYAGISFWMVDFMLQAIGQLLLLLRGTIPDFVSIVIGNTAIMAGMTILFVGLERFVGKKGIQIHNYALVAAFAAVHSYYGVINPNLEIRNINISLFIIIISFQCVWLMFRRVDDSFKRLTRGTGAVFFLYLFLSFCRVIIDSIAQSGTDFFKPSPFDIIIVLSYQMLGILLTFTLILMINGRLLMDIRSYAEEKKKMAGELSRLASTDTLTGINNRLKLDRTLTAEVLRSKRYIRSLSVMLLDVDHFKSVNDTYGHIMGDMVLQKIAAIIKEHVRKVDTVGRWGGEEFLIVSPETKLRGAVKLAEKLRKKIGNHSFPRVGKKTVSIGVAQLRKNEWDEDMLSRCDEALYRAKRKGRNRVEY
jgi:diguanylate cyclase (GGDEF)-like protein